MNGYQATRDDQGILTIHRVPIFVACSRGENDFDDAWITKAVQKAFQAASEGYHPPLHIRHHDAQSDVRAAGYFRVLGTDSIQFKGKLRTAIFADLVITDPTVQGEVLSRRLPYRSVEIFDVDNPAIDSLALLDHEAPYLELPMLMVSDVQDAGATMAQSVALTRVPSPWNGSGASREAAMVACFRRGHSAHVLFQHPNDMAPTPNPKQVQMACDEEKMADTYEEEKMMDEPKDDEQMQDGMMDVAAIVAAIEDGTISVADMDAIVAAVMARKAASEEPAEEVEEEVAAPAAAPGESMSRRRASSIEMARALGEVAALKARLEEREATDKRREDVTVALKRLEGRPLGSDLEQKLVAFHAKHGPKAFTAHVDAMVETFAAYSEDPRAAMFSNPVVPAVANRYLKDGVEAVDRAARFAREHAELVRGGHTRMSLDRYVELNMARN
jgi:hypothetical protein